MCKGGTGKITDIFRPHRMLGLPSLLDPMLHPNDPYNKPKVPEPEKVVQRQGYKDPVSRASLSSDDAETRRRMIAGVVTGARGVENMASTTRGVRALGGDQPLNPLLGGGGGSGGTPAAPVSSTQTPGATPSAPTSGGGGSAFAASIYANRWRPGGMRGDRMIQVSRV